MRMRMKLPISLAVFLPNLLVHAGGTSKRSEPIVDLGYAKYQGFVDPVSSNTHFWGIRYAAPPTGRLRFSAPQAPAKISGIQSASSHPSRCFQAGQGFSPVTPFRLPNTKRDIQISEDCLFLDVYTPGALGSRRNLPVIVWIHGGGYVSGSATGWLADGSDYYNGDSLIQSSPSGVVVVVIQYRLGVFGFMPGEKVKQGGALNAGILDQQMSLRWVQKHIAKFGGDPLKVTIWGQSAGAGSVLQHIVANNGNTNPPLFRGAILSSSFLPSQYRYDDVVPETLYNETVSKTNCSGAADTLSCLRQVDTAALQNANEEINGSGFWGTFVFVPVVDGKLITNRPTVLLGQGKINGEVVYAVTNQFEGELFINETETFEAVNYVENLFPAISSENALRAASSYNDVGDPLAQVIAIMGEAIFICPTYYVLRAFSGKSYKGEFAIPPGGHGNDLVYYFPTTSPTGPPYNNTQFVNSFAESFTAFATSLNPNKHLSDPTNITPFWGSWLSSDHVEMLFNRTNTSLSPVIRAIKSPEDVLERCRFWESVGAQTAQ